MPMSWTVVCTEAEQRTIIAAVMALGTADQRFNLKLDISLNLVAF